MARLYSFSFTAFSLAGTSWIHDLIGWTHDPGVIHVDGAGYNTQDPKQVFVGLGEKFPFEVQMSTGAADGTDGSDPDDYLEITNLMLTTFTVDAVDFIDQLRNWSVKVTSVARESKGHKNIRQRPFRTRREITGSFTIQVDSTQSDIPWIKAISNTSSLATWYGSSSPTHLPLVLQVTKPGGTTGDMLDLSVVATISPVHDTSQSEIQEIKVDWIHRGAPTLAAGTSILSTAFGDSQPLIAYIFGTGSDTITGASSTGFIHSMDIRGDDQSIYKISGELEAIAAPTWS